MLRPALAALACALVAPAAAAPHGRVVRVERPRGKPAGTPRICSVSPGEVSAYCIGKQPEVGDRIVVVDMHQVVATLRVDGATSAGSCSHGVQWQVQTQVESGDVAAAAASDMIWGIVDGGLDPRAAHLVKVEHAPGDLQISGDGVIGIDANGDGTADLEFLQLTCDDSGAPMANANNFCVEVWYAAGPRYEWLRTDRVQNCF